MRASCPSGLLAQLKGEKLTLVPATAEGFRATVSALRSLDGNTCVSFHTFSLPEHRSVRLLVKSLGKQMPENVVRVELKSVYIRVQEVMQLRSGRSDQDPTKDRHPTPHFIISVARGPEVSKARSLKALCIASAARVLVTRSVTTDMHPRCVACGGFHLSGWCPAPWGQPQFYSCGDDHAMN